MLKGVFVILFVFLASRALYRHLGHDRKPTKSEEMVAGAVPNGDLILKEDNG